jgi:hypothetical protein
MDINELIEKLQVMKTKYGEQKVEIHNQEDSNDIDYEIQDVWFTDEGYKVKVKIII